MDARLIGLACCFPNHDVGDVARDATAATTATHRSTSLNEMDKKATESGRIRACVLSCRV